MVAAIDESHAICELLEVEPLRCSKRMPLEVRNDRLQKILTSTNDVAIEMLSVIVYPSVYEHLSDSKELTKLVKTLDATCALRHRELVSDLVSGLVAAPVRSVVLPNETNGEASFSVYKTSHPATELDQSFLLIFRTRHVVTMVNVQSDVTR
jgi:hypothetical protein